MLQKGFVKFYAVPFRESGAQIFGGIPEYPFTVFLRAAVQKQKL
jgi:hypothetical protein